MLDEPDDQVKSHALKSLNAVVDQFWAEISDSISKIEVLYEDDKFLNRQLAALIASKVYYHLGDYDVALGFALGAGPYFDFSSKSEFVETIISKCIDQYIKLRVKQYDHPGYTVQIDPRMQEVVDRMFKRCFDDGQYRQAIGIALESRHLDYLEQAVISSTSLKETLVYARQVAMTLVLSRDFRNKVLRVLVKLFSTALPEPDYFSICEVLVFLNDPEGVTDVLRALLAGEEQEIRLALQIAFDLNENATQGFLRRVFDELAGGLDMDMDYASQARDSAEASNAMDIDAPSMGDASQGGPQTKQGTQLSASGERARAVLQKLRGIFNGEVVISSQLEFLFRNNHADMAVIKATKVSTKVLCFAEPY